MNNLNNIRPINTLVMILQTLINIALLAGYVMEYFKGNRSLSYTALYCVILLSISGILAYKYFKCKSSTTLKYYTMVGYLIIYVYSLFSAERLLVYTYIFPVVSVYILYFDLTVINIFGIISVLANVIKIILNVMNPETFNSSLTTDYTIQFAGVFIYSLALSISTKYSNKFNQEKLDKIEDQRLVQDGLLKDMVSRADLLKLNVKNVYDNLESFISSNNLIGDSINSISSGLSTTSQAIQEQTSLTLDIQDKIKEVTDLSTHLEDISLATKDFIKDGLKIVDDLQKSSTNVTNTGVKVHSLMRELNKMSNDVEGIANIITDISSKINLVSINAKIEAAKAGIVGAGFSVVAEEISALADKSSVSAGQITLILTELKEKANLSAKATEEMKIITEQQSDYVKSTLNAFDGVNNQMQLLESDITNMASGVHTIYNSNTLISEKITNISAITQDILANTEETLASSKANIENANKSKSLLDELVAQSNDLT